MPVVIKTLIPTDDKEKWATIFYSNYQLLVNIALEKLPSLIEAEQLVDELLIKVIQRKTGQSFESNAKALKYLIGCLNRNIKQWWAIRHHNQISALTTNEREYWFEFTRQLFDKILKPVNGNIL